MLSIIPNDVNFTNDIYDEIIIMTRHRCHVATATVITTARATAGAACESVKRTSAKNRMQ